MTFRYTLLLLAARVCLGQTPAELRHVPAVRAAMEAARRNEPRTLDLQARLCEIPAPPFQEAVRGQELQRLFQELGLRDVRADAAGNVIGVRPGPAGPRAPTWYSPPTSIPSSRKAPTSKSAARAMSSKPRASATIAAVLPSCSPSSAP